MNDGIKVINGLYEVEGDLSDSKLWNEDIAPTKLNQRTWTMWNIAALWVGMSVCIPTYMLAGGLIAGGMNWWEAIITILLGNSIVLIPMILNAHAGTKYGIPFPVLARASFGTLGSNIPALLRAVVACGWFGIQTWVGGSAVYALHKILTPGLINWLDGFPLVMGITFGQFTAFMIFWLINMVFIWIGTESIRWLETWSAPFLIIIGLVLLFWARANAHGFGPMLSQPSKFKTNLEFWTFFFPALTGMVGYWATLSLNIPDFTRYAKSQKDQMLGQAIGLPTTMTLYTFIGVAVTSATIVIFGEAIWDPVVLLSKFTSPIIVCISLFSLTIATISTNIAANIVSPANDFSNIAPRIISFKTGGTIAGIIGILIMPWKLLSDFSTYIFTWLIGYSGLLGPIAGVMICDYFIIRRMQLNVVDLYKEEGSYRYYGGFNILAIIALFAGILPNIPGFIQAASNGKYPTSAFFNSIYTYAWFSGLAISFIVYWFLMTTHQIIRVKNVNRQR
jgi:NCS1 family nucleobase:cation symporter-1